MLFQYFFLSPLIFVAFSSLGLAQEWTQELIPTEKRSHSFGTVAKDARVEHRFILKNKFEETVHISGLSASCTCTDISLLDNKAELQTYEETAIVARFRTDLFTGLKSATLTVAIDKPYRGVIQLNVHGEIRGDITVSPASVRFDNVKQGEEASRSISVDYRGYNPQWKIVDTKSSNEHLTGTIESVNSVPGSVKTKINVKFDDKTPNGEYFERLVVLTNDAERRREIPILVQATVGTTIKVTPQTVFFGYLKQGEPSPLKMAIIRGTQPFRIKKISCNNPSVEIQFTPSENESARTLYRIPVSYKNPKEGKDAPQNGKLLAVVKVETDQANLTPMFNITMETAKEETVLEP